LGEEGNDGWRWWRLAQGFSIVDTADQVSDEERWDAAATRQIIRTWGPRATPNESMLLPSEEDLAAAVALREEEVAKGVAKKAETRKLNAERVAAAKKSYEEWELYRAQQIAQLREAVNPLDYMELYRADYVDGHCRRCGGTMRAEGRCNLCGRRAS
jgi:hypothetical protein